jgi:hypothetical protein
MKKLLIFFVFSTILLACQQVLEPVASLVSYQQGDSRVYDVISEKYAIGSSPAKSKFQIKESITQVTHHSSHQLIEQDIYTRPDSTKEWMFVEKQILKLYPDRLIRQTSEGIFQDLVFPVFKDNKWDLSTSKIEAKAKYSDTNAAFEINKKTYQNCTIVSVFNISSLINLRKQQDVYSPSFGLIYRENTDLNYCQSTPSCIGKETIEFGFREIYSLKSISKN